MNKATFDKINTTLRGHGINFNMHTDGGSIIIDATNDTAARDALGLDRFRDYFGGVEVVIV